MSPRLDEIQAKVDAVMTAPEHNHPLHRIETMAKIANARERQFAEERAVLLEAMRAIADGLADTGTVPGKRMTLITKADAYEIARAAIAKTEGRS